MTDKSKATARDKYVEELKAQLDQWNAQLAKMEQMTQKTSAAAKAQYEQQLKDLRQRNKEVQQKLLEIQQANLDSWEDLRAGIEKSWGVMEDSIKQAWSRFNK